MHTDSAEEVIILWRIRWRQLVREEEQCLKSPDQFHGSHRMNDLFILNFDRLQQSQGNELTVSLKIVCMKFIDILQTETLLRNYRSLVDNPIFSDVKL